MTKYELFQLTPPIQRATIATIKTDVSGTFQLTPPIQRATKKAAKGTQITDISTHAPYTEGDYFYIKHYVIDQLFQLTPPIQRATEVP